MRGFLADTAEEQRARPLTRSQLSFSFISILAHFQAEFIFNLVFPQVWCKLPRGGRAKTRVRSRSKPARPYICRLRVFSRLMCPFTGPLLPLCSTAASTAL